MKPPDPTRWRVKHQSRKPSSFGLSDTVEGKDEAAAIAAVKAAHRDPRVIISVERLE